MRNKPKRTKVIKMRNGSTIELMGKAEEPMRGVHAKPAPVCGCYALNGLATKGQISYCDMHKAAPMLKVTIEKALDAVVNAPNGKPADRIVNTMVKILQSGIAEASR